MNPINQKDIIEILTTQNKESLINFTNNLIEQMILGTILNNNDSFELISDLIDENFFSNEYHKIFFKEIKERLHKGSIANIITLSANIKKYNIDTNYLLEISKYITNIDNLREYALIIKELYIKRECIILGDYLKLKAQDDNFLEEGIYKIEEKLYNLSTKTSDGFSTISFGEGLHQVKDNILSLLSSKKHIAGLTTGFVDLDALLGGLQNGALYILAARPSMGKSALAGNIAVNCAMDKTYGGPVAFISLEMPNNQIVMRIMSGLSNVPLNQLINGYISRKDLNDCMETLKNFYDLPLYVHDASSISIGEIKTILRQMKRKWNIQLAIIDYLQLIHSGNNNKQENRVAEVSRITRLLKATAKELAIPIMALSQLSRMAESNKTKLTAPNEGEDIHKPQLWHLRESGSIEQDADVVMFIVREDYYKSKISNSEDYKAPDNGIGLAKLYVDKNRNGATGTVKLMYSSFTTCFKNYTE